MHRFLPETPSDYSGITFVRDNRVRVRHAHVCPQRNDCFWAHADALPTTLREEMMGDEKIRCSHTHAAYYIAFRARVSLFCGSRSSAVVCAYVTFIYAKWFRHARTSVQYKSSAVATPLRCARSAEKFEYSLCDGDAASKDSGNHIHMMFSFTIHAPYMLHTPPPLPYMYSAPFRA